MIAAMSEVTAKKKKSADGDDKKSSKKGDASSKRSSSPKKEKKVSIAEPAIKSASGSADFEAGVIFSRYVSHHSEIAAGQTLVALK